VAFQWNGEKGDNDDIYVKQIGESNMPVRLTTDPATDFDPAWSPDGRTIAFERWQGSNAAIRLIPAAGGPERKLTEIAGHSYLSWTPDAKWLAFSERESRPEGTSSIWAINVDTLERRRLTTFAAQSAGVQSVLGDINPSLSPDGGALAFSRQARSFVCELYLQRLTRDLRPKGDPVKITDRHYMTVDGIAWTANRREIVYGAGNDAFSLWRVPVSGGQTPERLTYAAWSALQPVISRSTPRLVYTWQLFNGNLWRLDLGTGERKMLIGSSAYVQFVPQYSPDGRKVAFTSNQSGDPDVWTCDSDGTNCRQITYCGSQCGTPRWSPDGR
jgi:Tol biopolymer transport system component